MELKLKDKVKLINNFIFFFKTNKHLKSHVEKTQVVIIQPSFFKFNIKYLLNNYLKL